MRLVGCIRVSRVAGRAGESFISPDVQREQIELYARTRGHEIVAWQEDLDQPGSTLARPGLQQALAMIGRREAHGIIAAKLDRITRSLADLSHLLTRAREEHWNLVAVDLGLDLSTPNGRLVAQVLGSVAEWELDRRRQDWDLARAHAVARGVHVASRTPTGYLRCDDGRLEPDPDVAPIILELFRRRAAGEGWSALADFLDASGVTGPYGNANWTPGAVRTLITNRVYLGEARSGKHANPDAHEPLVPADVWHAAQTVRALPARKVNDDRLLAGIVRCSSCRYLMKTDTMRDARGNKLGMYRCRRRHAAGICPQPVAILARVIEPEIEAWFLDDLRQRAIAAAAGETTDALDEAKAELADAEAELELYAATTAITVVGRDVYERGLLIRAERVDAARQQVAAERRHNPQGALTPGDLLEAWEHLTVAERREALAPALDAVVVYPHRSGRLPGERFAIVEFGDGPVDLPRRGVRVPLRPWDESPGDVGMAARQDP